MNSIVRTNLLTGLLTTYLINSKRQSFPAKNCKVLSCSRDFQLKSKVHHRGRNSFTNPFHNFISYLFEIHFNIIILPILVSRNIITTITPRRKRLAGHVARIEETRKAHKTFIVKPEGKKSPGRPDMNGKMIGL